MVQLMKAGYTKDGGICARVNPDDQQKIDVYDVYCPKVVSCIGELDDVLRDRCLCLTLEKVSANIISNWKKSVRTTALKPANNRYVKTIAPPIRTARGYGIGNMDDNTLPLIIKFTMSNKRNWSSKKNENIKPFLLPKTRKKYSGME